MKQNVTIMTYTYLEVFFFPNSVMILSFRNVLRCYKYLPYA